MRLHRSGLLIFLWVISLLSAISVNALAQVPDPGLPGTYVVSKLEYNLGDTVFKPADFPNKVEVIGSVHYPTILSAGPFPVIVFLHGRHSTCYDTTNVNNTALAWPCSDTAQGGGPTYTSIASYEGYDYLAKQMASHGYIVISISCNAINADDNSLADYGMQARAELMQYHLNLWDTFNTGSRAPFGTLFIGRLNMQNIGTMGHSRGGEGVIYHALYNRSLGSPYGIRAVLPLAPVDFNRHVLNGIPIMDVSPYCDGDVNDIQGVHFYDDSRYADTADETPKHTLLLMGANHDFFNTVWTPGSYIAGGFDDWFYGYPSNAAWCGPTATPTGRFDTTVQKAALNAYLSAFFRLYIGHENAFAPILNVDDIAPPASSMLDTSQVFVAYHAGTAYRLDINRTDSLSKDTINTLRGAVTDTGLTQYYVCGGGTGLGMTDCNGTLNQAQEPHNSNSSIIGLAQTSIDWNDTLEWYENVIPYTYRNFSQYDALQFRATLNFKRYTAGSPLDFTVQLVDHLGNKSEQVVSHFSKALFFQPGTEFHDLPKMLFNTIKIPLSSFIGIEMNNISYIRFRFNKSATGAVLISDLAAVKSPCGKYADFIDSVGARYKVLFKNLSFTGETDSVKYLWNFGDPSTGVNDTSTLKSPYHTFSAAGNYTVCLYMTSYQQSGYICNDTLCSALTLLTDQVPIIAKKEITITPNPAKDRLHITGASATDVLSLMNMLGQVVFTTTITSPDILLPANLPEGIYCVVVTTGNDKIYKKLLLRR